jgi:hypothetical protein
MGAPASGREEIEQRYEPAHIANCLESSASSPHNKHKYETFRDSYIIQVSNFIQTPPVNERILLEASHTLR